MRGETLRDGSVAGSVVPPQQPLAPSLEVCSAGREHPLRAPALPGVQLATLSTLATLAHRGLEACAGRAAITRPGSARVSLQVRFGSGAPAEVTSSGFLGDVYGLPVHVEYHARLGRLAVLA